MKAKLLSIWYILTSKNFIVLAKDTKRNGIKAVANINILMMPSFMNAMLGIFKKGVDIVDGQVDKHNFEKELEDMLKNKN